MKKIVICFFIVSVLLILTSCDNTIFGESDWKYEVTGSAATVNITISNKNGNTEQQSSVTIPWTTTFTKDNTYTFFAYISAQNNGPSGDVTVKIYKNDKLVDSATSSGAYVIATASYYFN